MGLKVLLIELVVKQAIHFEENARDFYNDMQQKSKNPRAVEILQKLVKEEEKHIELLKNLYAHPETLQEQIKLAADKQLTTGHIVFPEASLPDENADVATVLRDALEREKASYNVYENLAKLAKISFLKNTFKVLANQEQKHIEYILQMQVEMNCAP